MIAGIREYAEKDLPTLVELINESYKHDYEFYPYNEERLRSWIGERKFRILMAEENGKIIGSAAYHDSSWGEEIEWIAVTESPNRKTLENAFVAELEKFVKSGKIFRPIDAESQRINEWIERGYRPEGGLYHMITMLDHVRTLPIIPEGINMRSLKPDEEKEFVEAVNAGFERERVKFGDIQLWKTESPPFGEEWIYVAEANGRIVSVVVAKPDTYFNNFFAGNRGYLGPAATLPEYRGKNLASALTARAMNHLLQKGMNSASLYTSETNCASLTLLQRIGFVVGHHWKFVRKTLPQRS
jgi:ribosomal protein S18 acetylase RimI-like enzyme